MFRVPRLIGSQKGRVRNNMREVYHISGASRSAFYKAQSHFCDMAHQGQSKNGLACQRIILAVRTDNNQESKGVDRFSIRNTNTMVSSPSRWCLHGECMRVEISAYIDANLHPSDWLQNHCSRTPEFSGILYDVSRFREVGNISRQTGTRNNHTQQQTRTIQTMQGYKQWL